MLPTDEELARQLQAAVRHIRRVRWAATGALALIVLTAMIAGTILLLHDQRELRASCQFYRDLGDIPVTTVAPATKPSELGVAIVAHARLAFTGQGCPGHLAPAGAGLLHWSAYYRIR